MAATAIKIKTLCFALVLVIIAETGVQWIAGRLGGNLLILMGVTRCMQTALMVWVVWWQDQGLAPIGLAQHTWTQGLKKGIVWSLGFALAVAMGFGIIAWCGRNPLLMVRTTLPAGEIECLLFFIVGGLIAPIAEEICFRGLIYGFFRRWGIGFAVVISTVLFVSLHAINGLPIPQIVGSIVFALAYETSQSLITPITIHALGNLAIFSLSLPVFQH